MPETSQFSFTPREVLEVLIKKQDIHEGIWALRFQLVLTGADIPYTRGTSNEPVPSAIVRIPTFLLQKLEKPQGNCLDAAKVNPASSAAPAKARGSKK
jgi:hypothetical protein